jgi:UDP-glucose 4-epimerase
VSGPSHVLITGVAGFVGSNLAERLVADGLQVTGIDDLSMGSMANLQAVMGSPSFRLVTGDVRDVSALARALEGADCVVHLAALKIPKYGNARETLLANTMGSERVLEAAADGGARLLLASTSDVYGMNPDMPLSEDGSYLVMGSSGVRRWAYAVSKIFDEHLCFAYGEERGLRFVVMRFFNSYGPHHHRSWWGGPQSVFIDAGLSGGTLTVHGDGSQRRCFTYMSDLIEGIARAIGSDAVDGNVLNIGNPDGEVTVTELAELVCELTGRDPAEAIRYEPYEKLFGHYQEVSRRVPDIRKARTLLGYAPCVSLREGLERTIAWHRTQDPAQPDPGTRA